MAARRACARIPGRAAGGAGARGWHVTASGEDRRLRFELPASPKHKITPQALCEVGLGMKRKALVAPGGRLICERCKG